MSVSLEEQLTTEDIIIAKAIPHAFIESCCWIINPSIKNEPIPFKLWPYQRDYLKVLEYCITHELPTHNDKSRDMGFSWLYMAFFLWGMSWCPGFSALVLAIKGADVDDGGQNSTPNSLFGRMRFMWNRLPDGHPLKAKLNFRKWVIYNEDSTDRFMQGSAATSDPGRGGRFKVGLWDEAAHPKVSGEEIWASLSSAVRCPVINSTPRGENNTFSRLKFESGIVHTSHHWKLHPTYSKGIYNCAERHAKCPHEERTGHGHEGGMHSPWFDQKILTMLRWQVEQELNIGYSRSLENIAFEEFDVDVHVAEGDIEYNPHLPLYRAWDFGVADPGVILFIQVTTDDVILVIDMSAKRNKHIDWHKDIANSRYDRLDAQDYGDHAGTQRGTKLDSAIKALGEPTPLEIDCEPCCIKYKPEVVRARRMPYNSSQTTKAPYYCDRCERTVIKALSSIYVQSKPHISANDKTNLIKKWLLAYYDGEGNSFGRVLISRYACKYLIDSLMNARYPTDMAGNVKTDSVLIHDDWIHPVDAFGYFLMLRFPYAPDHWPEHMLTEHQVELVKEMRHHAGEWAWGQTAAGSGLMDKRF